MASAYDKALSYLSDREHTEKEIRSKLKAKGYRDDEIDDAVKSLLSEGAISEERFAESYIRSRMRRNPEGKSILLMRLKEKGTPLAIAKDAIDMYFSDGSYIEPLSKLYKSLVSRKGEDKALIALYRKGFISGEIKEARELSKIDEE